MRRSWRGAVIGLVASLALARGRALAEAPLPAPLQAAILKKVLGYDKTLAAGSRVLVLPGSGEGGAASELAKALQSQGLAAEVVELSRLERELGAGAKVVYVFSGALGPAVKAACARAGALTVTGGSSAAEGGEVAVSLGQRDDGRPEIVVNRTELRAENHEFSSELLRLAKVVQ